MSNPIFREVEIMFRHLAHLPHYHQPGTPHQEAPMPLALITSIENDLAAAGHEVSDVLHGILNHHLTLANLAGHVADGIAAVQANPLAPVVERFALGAGGEAFLAQIVQDAAAFLKGTQAAAAPSIAVDEQNLHAGDVGQPVPAGPVVGGQAQ